MRSVATGTPDWIRAKAANEHDFVQHVPFLSFASVWQLFPKIKRLRGKDKKIPSEVLSQLLSCLCFLHFARAVVLDDIRIECKTICVMHRGRGHAWSPCFLLRNMLEN